MLGFVQTAVVPSLRQGPSPAELIGLAPNSHQFSGRYYSVGRIPLHSCPLQSRNLSLELLSSFLHSPYHLTCCLSSSLHDASSPSMRIFPTKPLLTLKALRFGLSKWQK